MTKQKYSKDFAVELMTEILTHYSNKLNPNIDLGKTYEILYEALHNEELSLESIDSIGQEVLDTASHSVTPSHTKH